MKIYIVKFIDSIDKSCGYVAHDSLKSAREHAEHIEEIGHEAHIRLAAKSLQTQGWLTHEIDEEDWCVSSDVPARK